MLVDLVRTVTADGHRLDGALVEPAAESSRTLPLDALLLLHGVASNFYAGSLFDHLSTEFSDRGVAVLRVNTRGHDGMSVTFGRHGPVRQGAAYEIVDDCRLDIRAWIELLRRRGFSRIGLFGHSLGAIKAIYAQAYESLPEVKCVLACSPPRLSYSAFMASDVQPLFFESYSTAREHVQRGQPDALVLSKYPAPVWIAAKGYVDKYGPEERYNILKFVDRVECPVLATYGELELASGGIAFAGMDQALPARRRADQRLDVVSIAKADHAYSGVFPALVEALLGWIPQAVTEDD